MEYSQGWLQNLTWSTQKQILKNPFNFEIENILGLSIPKNNGRNNTFLIYELVHKEKKSHSRCKIKLMESGKSDTCNHISSVHKACLNYMCMKGQDFYQLQNGN